MTPGVYWCVWPVSWPDPSITDRGGVAPATCWTPFDTPAARAAHYELAHPELSAERAGPARPLKHAGQDEIVHNPTPIVRVSDADWRCSSYGCTAPLSAHPVELAARALARS